MSQYLRVIPRDFFNEAKLLKSLGRLSLSILDNKKGISKYIYEDYDHDPFEIQQTIDGDIYVVNYKIFKKNNETEIDLYSFLNSKANYPLFFINDEGERTYVFDGEGEFTKEFLDYAKK